MIKTKLLLINEAEEVENYKAVFINREELGVFTKENNDEGIHVEILDMKRISVVDLWNDKDFEEDYKVELIGEFLIPKDVFKSLKKTTQVREYLEDMGIL